jgi:hypothetical protein
MCNRTHLDYLGDQRISNVCLLPVIEVVIELYYVKQYTPLLARPLILRSVVIRKRIVDSTVFTIHIQGKLRAMPLNGNLVPA